MTIYILALHGVATGGPEATHQLSDALIEQGFDARLVYFKWEDLSGGIPAEFPEYGSFAGEYDRYRVKLARSLPDESGSVIVLPETAAMLVPAFERAKVLVWWLSVDNAFGALSAVNLNYLRLPNVYHASQSQYAAKFCEALQLNHIGMLSDYTVDLTEYATPMPMGERPKLVAFNARPDKVIADLPAIGEAIANLDPEIKCIAIAGMKRAEIAAVFAAARVYVDLGNFPGKDRLPREAASMWCVPIVLDAGGGHEMFTRACPRIAAQIMHAPHAIAREAVYWAQHMDIKHIPPPSPEAPEKIAFNAEVRDVFSKLV